MIVKRVSDFSIQVQWGNLCLFPIKYENDNICSCLEIEVKFVFMEAMYV